MVIPTITGTHRAEMAIGSPIRFNFRETVRPQTMMNQEVEQWQAAADELLAKSALLTLLKNYGEVYITGSYRYGLMTSGDIDLYVLNANTNKESAAQLLSDLVQQGVWTGYLFYDWVQFRHPDFPCGYYIGLKSYPDDVRWKVDIWMLKELTTEQYRYNKRMETTLTPEMRDLILAIKKERDKKKWKIFSTEIYNAVLDGKVDSVEEFRRQFVNG